MFAENRAYGYPHHLMLVFAHRGFHGRTRTENTLEAFHEAVAMGAGGIELDLRLSKDGEIVVVHDTNLHRIAGDAHRVNELSAEDLSKIPLRYGGSIVTFNEVTASIHAPIQLDVDIKESAVIEPLLRKLGTSASLRERVIVSSFQTKQLMQIRKAFPDVRTLQLLLRWPLPLRGEKLWNRVRRLNPWGIAFPLPMLNASRIAHLRTFGVVGAWDTRFTASEAHKALDLKLDFAIVHRIREASGLDERGNAK